MNQHVTLIGAETVQQAGSSIHSAATEMNRAAGRIEDALQRHSQHMEQCLERLDFMLQTLVEALNKERS